MMNFILGKDIAYYVRQHRGLVVLALVLAAFSSILVVIPAYLLQPFVDEGMKTGSDPVAWKIPWITFEQGSWFSWHKTERVLVDGVSPNRLLLILTVIAVVASLCKSVTVYFSQYAAAAFSNRAVQSLRIDLFKKFVSLPLGFYHGKRSGEMIARAVADLTVLQGRIAQVLIELVQHPLTIIVFLAYLLFTNYQLTLMVFLVGPVIIGLVRLFSRKVKKHSKGVQDATAEVTADYQESLLNLKVIQGYGKEDFEVSGFRVVAERLYQKIMRWRRWDLGVGPGMDATVFIIAPGFLIVAKVYFDHSLGELLSIIYAFSRLYAPVKKLGRVVSSIKTLQGATERVFDIMHTKPDIDDRPGATPLPRHQKSIRFDRVDFHYAPGNPILQDVSFEVPAGDMVAFVGSTGAGKSTLLDLVPRFYDVTGGSIIIDGDRHRQPGRSAVPRYDHQQHPLRPTGRLPRRHRFRGASGQCPRVYPGPAKGI